jgi:hypothetical protein
MTWIWTYGIWKPVDDLVRDCIQFYNFYVAKPPYTPIMVRWSREDESPKFPPVTKINTVSGFKRRKEEDPGYRGVYRHERKWVVKYYMGERNRFVYGGIYTHADEAAKAWDKLALHYQGDKAKLNFESSRR